MNKKIPMSKALAESIAVHIASKAFEIPRKNWEIKRVAFSELVYIKLVDQTELNKAKSANLSAWIEKRRDQTIELMTVKESEGSHLVSYQTKKFDLKFSKDLYVPLLWAHGRAYHIDDFLALEARKLKAELQKINDDQAELRDSISSKLLGFSHMHKEIAAWPELLGLLPEPVKSAYLTPPAKAPVVVDFSELSNKIKEKMDTKPLKAA